MHYDKRWDEKLPTAPAEPWREILNRAADILEQDGWCQGTLHRDTASCAVGAMVLAARRSLNGPFQLATHQLERHLGRSGHVISIPDWNNAPERTQAEVIATLRACAES